MVEPHIYLEDFDLVSGSSTEIRNALKSHSESNIIDDVVLEYIEGHRLYEPK